MTAGGTRGSSWSAVFVLLSPATPTPPHLTAVIPPQLARLLTLHNFLIILTTTRPGMVSLYITTSWNGLTLYYHVMEWSHFILPRHGVVSLYITTSWNGLTLYYHVTEWSHFILPRLGMVPLYITTSWNGLTLYYHVMEWFHFILSRPGMISLNITTSRSGLALSWPCISRLINRIWELALIALLKPICIYSQIDIFGELGGNKACYSQELHYTDRTLDNDTGCRPWVETYTPFRQQWLYCII